MATYDATELTKLYVFGTATPSTDDYNLHIRPISVVNAFAGSPSVQVTKPYDMQNYMYNGAGRYALPSLFGAIEKIFGATIPDSNTEPYTLQKLQEKLGLQFTESDLKITISNYGTDILSSDHNDRSFILGNSDFELDLTAASFTVVNGGCYHQQYEGKCNTRWLRL